MAVDLFAIILQLAESSEATFTSAEVGLLFLKEAGGALVLGGILGFAASRVMRQVDEHNVSALITLSVVMGGYLVAQALQFSGPLTMVLAGLIIGATGTRNLLLLRS